MISKKTCLVLGAGASRPYKLPTSGELRHIIIGREQGNEAFAKLHEAGGNASALFRRDIIQGGFSPGELDSFQEEFFNAQRVSVDAFLARAKDEFEAIGKFAIALAILMCERSSELNENWYQWLLEELVRDGSDFDASNLRIITFNYDRSFEFYFWRAFAATFRINRMKALDMLRRIEIVHVYGHCGELHGTDGIPYGDTKSAARAAESISVVAPRCSPESAPRIQEIIRESERLCFLGFGFWDENLDLLGLDNSNKKVFASAYHLGERTKQRVKTRLSPKFIKRLIFGESEHDVLAFLNAHDVLG